MPTKNAIITGADQWTDWLELRGDGRQFFSVDIDADAPFVATLTVQMRRADNITKVKDLETYTDVDSRVGEGVGSFDVRVGCKAGDYTSGTIDVEINS